MVPKNQWDARSLVLTEDQYLRDITASDPERLFALVTDIACRWLDVPMALIGLKNGNRWWVKRGVGEPLTEIKLGQSVIDQIVSQDTVLVPANVASDPRFRDVALGTSKARVQAFAGAPLRRQGKQAVGAFCVMDTKAHPFSEDDKRTINDLAAMLGEHFTFDGFTQTPGAGFFATGETEAGAHFNNVLRGVVAHDSYSVALRRRGDWPRQTSENAVGHGEPSPLVSAKDHLPELPPSEWADDLNVMFSQSRFMSLGDAEFNRCVRHDHCLALLIVRVDGLKHLSRQIGAASADKVLTALTTRWRGAIRDHDLIGRLGVETFGILLPETDTERAAAVAARLRDAMAKESASGSHPKTDLELEVGVSSLSSNHHCFDDIYSDAEMVLTNSLKSKQFNQSSVVA